MIIVNTDTITGKKIVKMLGIAEGSSIKTRWVGKDILSGFRTLVGGELKEYTQMMNESRDVALKRLQASAEKMGANAVINVRFMTSSIMSNAAEILVYGTAVVVEDV